MWFVLLHQFQSMTSSRINPPRSWRLVYTLFGSQQTEPSVFGNVVETTNAFNHLLILHLRIEKLENVIEHYSKLGRPYLHHSIWVALRLRLSHMLIVVDFAFATAFHCDLVWIWPARSPDSQCTHVCLPPPLPSSSLSISIVRMHRPIHRMQYCQRSLHWAMAASRWTSMSIRAI